MPELPEVETVMRGLAPVLEGATINNAEARRPNLRFPIPTDFAERLTGNRVERLTRRSKYILIECADGLVVIMHLGMSGRISIYAAGTEPNTQGKHDHIIITTTEGDTIVYTDPRRFGLWVFSDRETIQHHPLIRDIGPEPLGNQFSTETLAKGFKNRKTSIKTALLDQKLVAGLGNIYVCEVLWRAGIHPERTAASMNPAEIDLLPRLIRDVLTEAIEAGGSTLKDYAQVDGELGYFQHRFQAYGREGESCYKQGCNGMVSRIVQGGRSTFFCDSCQK